MGGVLSIIVIAAVTLLAVVWARWTNSHFDYQCPNCGEIFSLSVLQAMAVPHMSGRKLVRCPNCGRVSWATPVAKRNGG